MTLYEIRDFYKGQIEFYERQIESDNKNIEWLNKQIKREREYCVIDGERFESLDLIELKKLRAKAYRNRKTNKKYVEQYKKDIAKLYKEFPEIKEEDTTTETKTITEATEDAYKIEQINATTWANIYGIYTRAGKPAGTVEIKLGGPEAGTYFYTLDSKHTKRDIKRIWTAYQKRAG